MFTFITPSTLNPLTLDPQPPRPTTIPNYPLDQSWKCVNLGLVYNRVRLYWWALFIYIVGAICVFVIRPYIDYQWIGHNRFCVGTPISYSSMRAAFTRQSVPGQTMLCQMWRWWPSYETTLGEFSVSARVLCVDFDARYNAHAHRASWYNEGGLIALFAPSSHVKGISVFHRICLIIYNNNYIIVSTAYSWSHMHCDLKFLECGVFLMWELRELAASRYNIILRLLEVENIWMPVWHFICIFGLWPATLPAIWLPSNGIKNILLL